MLSWNDALQQTRYKVLTIYIFVSTLLFLIFFPAYFSFIQNKPGIMLHDVLLRILPAMDVSVPIFIMIYLAIGATILLHAKHAGIMLIALGTYCTATYFRLATIYLFTLEPPADWVALHDPVVSLVAYDSGFAKDLFFSGHISTLCVTIFIEPKKIWRWIKVAATVSVAVLLLIQHIHYTIDILAAPLFTYASYLIIRELIIVR